MTKREELYCLLALYKDGRYDVATFCDELTRILYYESGGINELTGNEKIYLDALGKTAERYSPYEEDLCASKWFCGEDEVKKAIEEVCSKLFHV